MMMAITESTNDRSMHDRSSRERSSRERASFVHDTAGSILTVHIRGEIDHHTAASIRQGIDGLLYERRPRKLILDLSAVNFMDSSGLGLIMGRLSLVRELGGELTVWNPSRETQSILTLAGMERLVRIEYPKSAEGAGAPSAQASKSGKSTADKPTGAKSRTASGKRTRRRVGEGQA